MRRRTFLAIGGAGVGAAALGGAWAATDTAPRGPGGGDAPQGGGPGAGRTPGEVPDVPAGRVETHRVASRARSAVPRLITMVPHGIGAQQARELPVCVVLHPRDSSARGMVGLGMPQFLTAAVRSGVPPFALAAVDGGQDSYWHAIGRNDPQEMLLEELPGWLGEAGLGLPDDGVPRAALGISMGGYGSLVYARRRRTLDAVAVLSPALFRSWEAARTYGPFPDRRDWEGTEPLRHVDDLGIDAAGLGVWCGRQDPFHRAAREFAARSGAAVGGFTDGAHDPGYWRAVMPHALEFVGRRLAGDQ